MALLEPKVTVLLLRLSVLLMAKLPPARPLGAWTPRFPGLREETIPNLEPELLHKAQLSRYAALEGMLGGWQLVYMEGH